MSRGALAQLSDEQLVALQLRGGQWPRSLFAPALIPDAWMGLLEHADGWRKFVPSGEDPRPSGDARLTLVRNRPIAVPVEVDDLRAGGGEDITLRGELLLRWQQRDDDLSALARQLATRTRLNLQDLAALLREPLRSAASVFASARPVEALTGVDLREPLSQHLHEHLRAQAFEWGFAIERVTRCDAISRAAAERAAVQRDASRRIEHIRAGQLVEQAALAATQQKLAGLRSMLGELQSTAQGDARVGRELLASLDPAERGRVLANLWRIVPSSCRTHAIVAVGGFNCVWLNPDDPQQVTRRLEVPDLLGPLRSVGCTVGCDAVLLGAAKGVWRVASDCTSKPAPLRAPDAAGAVHRFNAVAGREQEVYGTHTQLGCWRWSAEGVAAPLLQSSIGMPQSVRALVLCDDSIWFAADDRVLCAEKGQGPPRQIGNPIGSTIHSLAVGATDLFAGCGDASVRRCAIDGSTDWEIIARGDGPVASLALRSWGDLDELLFPAGHRGVLALYWREQVTVAQLEPPAGLGGRVAPIDRVWAAADLLAALNSDLGRLYVRTASTPDGVIREVLLARLLGRPVEDVCLQTAAV